MSTTDTGHLAEEAVAQQLKRKGWEVIDKNWRTRFCEIDIIAKQSNCIVFVEVKYRRNTHQGSGLDYITPAKLKQMRFAAESWVQHNSWDGDYSLGAIEVTGNDLVVGELITDF